MEAVIDVQGLQRVFRSPIGPLGRHVREVRALAGVTFTVARGELLGFLGPNGAGKTTITKILATILLPTDGTARVLGFDVVTEAHQVRPHIGIVFGGERGLYWRLSGRGNMEYFAALYHVPPNVTHQRIPKLLEMVGLADRAPERVENYSRGMRQRLHIARALIHDPAVLIMDEPTIGLDPSAAREIRQIVRDLSAAGKTIFLTSHYTHEIDELCHRVAVLHRGRILRCETPRSLKSAVRDLEVVEIEIFGTPETVVARLRGLPAVQAVVVQPREHAQVVQVQAGEGSAALPGIMACLEGIRVGKILTREPTLEDAYLRLVGSDGYVV
jgi:ABC-2 type transport system ATP-binding protein